MATITEDYVSFEMAKLLKEKGFDEPCYAEYYVPTKEFNHFEYEGNNNENYKEWITAPTLQMAMKWLRKAHNLFIEIDRHYFVADKISHIASGYKYSFEIKIVNTVYAHNDYRTYEEACEAAIKYCLEHLIKK